MEEKTIDNTNSKKNKKHIIINIFLAILFIAVICFVIYFYLNNNKKQKLIDENKVYYYEIKDNVVYLKTNDGLEESYKCKNNCEIYTRGTLQGYFSKGKILLQDGVQIYLYDLLNNKKISANYNWVDYIYDDQGTELNNIKMFKVADSYSKQGIIDLNGNVLVKPIYDELGKTLDEDLLNYSFEDNYISAKSGDKWGLIALTNGKGLIDFQYEDIKINYYDKIVVKDSAVWILVDQNNKKIINKTFSSIDVHDKYLVVSEAKKAYIVNLNGDLASNKIDLYYDIDTWATITIKGLNSYEEEGIIYIEVDTPLDVNAGTSKIIKYYYDEENNEIKIVE